LPEKNHIHNIKKGPGIKMKRKQWNPKPSKSFDITQPLDIGEEIKRQIDHAMRNSGPSGIESLTEIEFLLVEMKKAMGYKEEE
jgi:hypothetical protein